MVNEIIIMDGEDGRKLDADSFWNVMDIVSDIGEKLGMDIWNLMAEKLAESKAGNISIISKDMSVRVNIINRLDDIVFTADAPERKCAFRFLKSSFR